MIYKSYKRNIAEGRNILIFSILFAVVIRVVYYFLSDSSLLSDNTGNVDYLWTPVSFIFADRLVSYISGFACLIVIALYSDYINNRYVLIRRKTSLAAGMPFLMFSSSPLFFTISGEYVNLLFVLFGISALFRVYEEPRKQMGALSLGLSLAIGSLFSPLSLLLFPVFWIGLSIVNGLSFKTFLASLLGLILIYVPVFSYFFFTDNINGFVEPFVHIGGANIHYLYIFELDYVQGVIYALATILLAVIAVNSYTTQYKDKIRIRTFISFLVFISVLSFLAYSFLNLGSCLYLFVGLCSSSFLMAHFFALAEEKWICLLFYLLLIIIIAAGLLSLIHI